MQSYTAHLAYHGVDVLVELREDGPPTIASRHGTDERWNAWSAPVELIPVSDRVSE